MSLSPASLAHLQQPQDSFDIAELMNSEDSEFNRNLQKLSEINWADPDEVDALLPESTMILGREIVPITLERLPEYIRQEQFQRSILSIRKEMDCVKAGFDGFLRHGALSRISPSELMELLGGSRDLTADMVIAGIDFPQGALVMETRDWLVSIIRELSPAELRRFHKFVTGSVLPPAGLVEGQKWMNFQQTTPAIPRSKRSKTNVHNLALPRSRTCFSALYAPAYPSKAVFKQKLLLAISDGITLEEH